MPEREPEPDPTLDGPTQHLEAGADGADGSSRSGATAAEPTLRLSRPGRDARVWCSIALTVSVGYGLIFLPLRPLLLAMSPEALAAITGSRLALVALGVLARTGEATLWWPVPLAIVSIMKFHWVYWWAGRLWGDQVLTRLGGSTPRARKRIARAEALVRRYQVLAVAVTYVPLPVAREVVLAGIGASGVRLRTFVLVDLAIAALTQLACVAAGLAIGERAVPVLRQYAVWAGLISVVVLVAMIATWWRTRPRRVRHPRTAASAGVGDVDEPVGGG